MWRLANLIWLMILYCMITTSTIVSVVPFRIVTNYIKWSGTVCHLQESVGNLLWRICQTWQLSKLNFLKKNLLSVVTTCRLQQLVQDMIWLWKWHTQGVVWLRKWYGLAHDFRSQLICWDMFGKGYSLSVTPHYLRSLNFFSRVVSNKYMIYKWAYSCGLRFNQSVWSTKWALRLWSFRENRFEPFKVINIGVTIPGNWSFEIQRISWNSADFVKFGGFREIRQISWNPPKNLTKHRVTIPCKWSFVVKSGTFYMLFMRFSCASPWLYWGILTA